MANIIAGLIAYTYQEKKPSLNLTTEDLAVLPEAHSSANEALRAGCRLARLRRTQVYVGRVSRFYEQARAQPASSPPASTQPSPSP